MPLPLLTLSLCALAGGLMLLPAGVRELLYFDRALLTSGALQGLVTGHWLHTDAGHLLWNTAALAVLGGIIEMQSRRLLLWSLVAGTVAVDALLLSPPGELQRYCGLSGLLNTLLGLALYLRWRATGSTIPILIGIAAATKIAFEIDAGQALLTNTSWPAYAPAHLAGAAGAIALIACWRASAPAGRRPG